MKNILITLIISISNLAFGQNAELKDIIGIYSDDLLGIHTTKLELNENYSFKLETVDLIFPYTYKSYFNVGKYKIVDDVIVLNPDKVPRQTKVKVNQIKESKEKDSVLIEINYFLERYQNEELVAKEKFDFDLLTIFINKRKKRYNVVQKPKIRNCSFTPRIKNQVTIDTNHQIRIKKVNIERIGIYTYGFDEIKWYEVNDSQVNKFEFVIEQASDDERMPRNKKIRIKKNKAYFYEKYGKISRSLIPLIKKE